MKDVMAQITRLICPLGALIVIVFFFLPWANGSLSIGDVKLIDINLSGNDIGGSMWIVFAAGLIIIAAFVISLNQNLVRKAQVLVVISNAIALIVILIKYIVTDTPEDLNLDQYLTVTVEYGAILTLMGFLVTLVGIPFLKAQVTDNNNDLKAWRH